MNIATAVSSSQNEMLREPIWQQTARGWSQSTPIVLDSRGRVDPTTSAASCVVECRSFGEKEEVVLVEVTQAVIPVPAATTATVAYLRLSFGQVDIERGAVEPWNIWYTEIVPLRTIDLNRVINLREAMQGLRTLKFYNPPLLSLGTTVTMRLFTIDAAGQIVDLPYVADLLPANNFSVVVEVNTFKN
jgi:hypothetical protein